ncbi:MAG: type II toxin-antitoxin system death-on-curing family toxin [Opitutales bacterium]|nr:type II toxin-antitoxin system death-on-curing family toxin [Opitutales bacterium]MCH8541723.1 type II toxin-antitoxin system death-on-curing family toxin [Opitutales bacterium]
MTEPIWITKEECLSFHQQLVARFGGLDGLRDEGLLDSALNRPQQLYHYEDPSLVELAAAYAEGIVKNHPFLDGNKRSGLMAAALFLETNGQMFTASEEEAVLQTLALAAGEIGASEYGKWLKANTTAR